MASISDFFIKDAANEGKKINLTFPDGRDSGEWVVIYSIHSDSFGNAQAAAMRKVLQNKADGKISEGGNHELLASLIKSWSFDEPLTIENAVNFIKNAPQIATKINSLAADSEFFYQKKPES